MGRKGTYMKRHWAYFKYVLRHKWFVFWACLKYKVPIWRAIIHDWSKFTPAEWIPYANSFYNEDGSRRRAGGGAYDPTLIALEFSYAWNHHEKTNPHHWGHWIVTSGDYGKFEVLPMPETYVREMLADWEGANRANGGDGNSITWYTKNKDKFSMHEKTRVLVETLLNI